MKSLNKEQKEAVTHDKGPLLIVAGAGTGKTTVITRRIAWLIASKKALPSEILALTFTDKAAGEMEERVDELVPYGFIDTWISTFHAFGDRILRDHALDLGLTTDFRVLSKPEQVIFMQDNLGAFDLKYFSPLGNPTKHIDALLGHFSKLKDELISPEEYLAYADSRLKELSSTISSGQNPKHEILNPKQIKNKKYQNFSNLENLNLDIVSDLEIRNSDLKTKKKYEASEAGLIEVKKLLELARSYERYQELMAEAGNLDFGDQINMIIHLFKTQPAVLKKYQKQFKYILVDEFQDTNYAQNELLKLLALGNDQFPISNFQSNINDQNLKVQRGLDSRLRGNDKNNGGNDRKRNGENFANITVVGDDDQSIYRFRGAAISNILQFPKDYPKCKQIVLTENYRSTQAILDSAYKLIKHNNPDRLEVKNNIIKKLTSKFDADSVEPIHLHSDTLTAETDRVAKMIRDYFDEGRYSFKDFAILSRSRRNAEDFIHALNHYGVPYKFSGSSGLYSRAEIRLLINFAKVMVSSGDDLAFYHLITSDVYGMDVSEAVKLNSESHKSRKSLEYVAKGFWTSLPRRQTGQNNKQKSQSLSSVIPAKAGIQSGIGLNEKSRAILDRMLADLKNFREESKKLTAGQVIYMFLKETGYLQKLVTESEKSVEAQVAIQNIAKFFERIGDFEKVSEDKSIVNFVRHLKALMDAGDDPAMAEVDPDLEAVSVLTVHSAKGLEFPVVFMVSLVSDSFPTRKRAEQLPIPEELIKESLPEGDWHLQEERRLFYVGMTRAKEILYLTSAEDYGGKRARKVSQFVLEAIDKPAPAKEKVKLDKVQVIERFRKRDEIVIPKKFYDGKGLLTLNPHQIDDYLSCPKKFEYIHILRVPIMTHHSVVYGSAIHKAIESYFVAKKAGKKVSLDDLIEVFSANWRSEGFITREHEDKRFRQGKKSLAEFFAREEAGNQLPEEVEAKFEIPLQDLDVKIRGRFDAIYVKCKTENVKCEQTEIRDFKTSEVENQEQADKKAKANRQLSVYALAKQTETGVIPEVSLYFVDSGLVGKIQKKEKDLDKVREEVERVVGGIKSENFKASPGFGECSRCAYREICPFTLTR